MTKTTIRNKLLRKLDTSFTITPKNDAETKAILAFEAEGLCSIHDISDGTHPFWRVCAL